MGSRKVDQLCFRMSYGFRWKIKFKKGDAPKKSEIVISLKLIISKLKVYINQYIEQSLLINISKIQRRCPIFGGDSQEKCHLGLVFSL